MRRSRIELDRVDGYLQNIFGEELHAKRVLSLANGTLGVMHASALGVHLIGHGLALARGLDSKHAIKQVDRLLSNEGIRPDDVFALWVPHVLQQRPRAVVTLDWTDHDADNQTTLSLCVVTKHGRATPLMWRSFYKDQLKDQRNDHEDALVRDFAALVPEGVRVTLLADRGFADVAYFEFLDRLGLEYIIRIRGNVLVESEDGEVRPAAEWTPPGGRGKLLRHAKITHAKYQVGSVLCVQDHGMKEPWCLATNSKTILASDLKKLYGRRFTTEETFRDQKDPRFGLGMADARIGETERRDRMLMLAALAQYLLTVLGAAGEALGLDRRLKSNTSKRRQLSLFRQGLLWFAALPNGKPEVVQPLLTKFGEMLRQLPNLGEVFSHV